MCHATRSCPLSTTAAVNTSGLQVMGVTFLWGWSLGAVEGMSITSLVGLSVDYCIHLAEGHLHAQPQQRKLNARCAPAGCVSRLFVCLHRVVPVSFAVRLMVRADIVRCLRKGLGGGSTALLPV